MLSLSPPSMVSTLLRSPPASPSSAPSTSSASSLTLSRLSPPSAAPPRCSNALVTPESTSYDDTPTPTPTNTSTASPSTSPRPPAPSLSPSRMAMRASTHVSGELLRPPRPGPAFRPLSPILSPSLPASSSTNLDPKVVDYINNDHHTRDYDDDQIMDDTRLVSTPDFGSSPDLTLPAATVSSSTHGVTKHKRPPLFHIPTSSTSDNEDDDPPSAAGPSRHPSRISLVDPGVEVDPTPAPAAPDTAEQEAAKRHIRQSHALLELLSTEQAYLTDLRILVSIYLRNLDIFGPQPKSAAKSTSSSKHSRPKTPTSHSHHGHGHGHVHGHSNRDSNSHLSYAFHSSLVMPSFVRQVPPGPVQTTKPLPKPPSDEKPATVNGKASKGHSRASSVPQAPALSTISLNTLPTEVEANAAVPVEEKPVKKPSAPAHLNLLTPSEILTIRSNASALLTLHTSFSTTLSTALSPFPSLSSQSPSLSSSSSTPEEIRAATSAIARAFITSAPSFGAYEAYCARHPDAQDIVRRLMGKHPAEWRAYERLCAAQAAELLHGPTTHSSEQEGENAPIGAAVRPASPARAHTSGPVFTSARARRHSLPSLALVSRIKPADLLPAELPASAQAKTKATSAGPKLAFLDYLIKPVQRICRYPLLLDALSRTSAPTNPSSSPDTQPNDGRPRRRDSTSAHGTFSLLGGSMRSPAENAGQVMRGVVLAVDDARSRREMLARGARIASRMILGVPAAAPANVELGGVEGGEEGRRMRAPTPAFVSSLGPCVLAGAVDVLLHNTSSAVSAVVASSPTDGVGELGTAVVGSGAVMHVKYLGAFLYKGGWMLLVKVKRAGLEPRHWIPLARAEVDDVEDIEGGLPNTIRIRFAGHALDLISACKREKEVWLDAMLETRAVERSARADWMDEPVCSLSLLQGRKHPPPPPPALQIVPMPTSAVRDEDEGPLSPDDVLSDVRSLCTAESGITSVGGHAQYAAQIQPVRQLSGGSTGATPSNVNTSSGLPPTSRRSSLLFLSNAFSPSSSSAPSAQNLNSSAASTGITVRRTPSHSRSAVDRALSDVFSPSIADARYRAQAADEVLWPAGGSASGSGGAGGGGSASTPKRNAFSRSGSALRIGGRTDTVVSFRRGASSGDVLAAVAPATAATTGVAMVTPSTQMSASVPMNREASSLSTVVPPTPTPASANGQVETTTPTRPTPTRSQSARWRAPRSLMITPIVDWALSEDGHGHNPRARSATTDGHMGISSAFAVATSPTEDGHGARSDSPDLLSASACSSHGHGHTLSPAFTLATLAPPAPITAPNTMADRPKRTRSLVDNLRGIFAPRSPSTTTTTTTSSSPAHATPTVVIYAPDGPPASTAGPGPGSPARVRWWSKGSLRRRVKSAPDAPEDEHHHHRGVATAPASTSNLLMATHAATVLGHGDDANGSTSASGSMPRPAPPVRRRSVFARFAEMRAVVPPAPASGVRVEGEGNVAQTMREGEGMETTKTAKVRRRQSLKLLFSGSAGARPTSPAPEPMSLAT